MIVKKSPRSLNNIIFTLKNEYEVVISKSHLRKIIKEIGFVWKRVRKSLKENRDQKKFNTAKKDIEVLLDKHNKGEIKLYYFDGSHFSLTPSVPYAWQEKGKEISVLSQKGGQQNVLGLLSPENEFKSLMFETKIDSETVIYALNEFFKYKRQGEKYTIIIDNAPVHKSDAFLEAIEKWRKRGITLYFLPPYSPELNKIEILWRFIKYSWLPLESFANKESLFDGLVYILKNIGIKYRITFS